ncbi:hypothetical protein [Spirillospora sp. CA-294931]|uniref:hypothetical protein n=1 Tax=Spirillospora sp. CA-294931 TaxID=3240042 RepID=UPI003D8F196A
MTLVTLGQIAPTRPLAPSDLASFFPSRGFAPGRTLEAAIMWLNLIIMSVASLVVGFVIGWIVACPRRWDGHFTEKPAAAPEELPSFTRVTGEA